MEEQEDGFRFLIMGNLGSNSNYVNQDYMDQYMKNWVIKTLLHSIHQLSQHQNKPIECFESDSCLFACFGGWQKL